MITFKNGKIDQFLNQIPLENIVLETDAPYLSPVPFRGKRNESGYITYVLKKVAELYDKSELEIAKITTKTLLKYLTFNMSKASKPKILLIYTGGTIGMVKDSKNGALKAFNFDNLLRRIPEIKLLDCLIDTISFDTPIDSSNVIPENWVEMAEIIENHYDEYDGFVILHGSDTMSYSASALSFMLENLVEANYISQGSQLPIGDLRTDAKENLITSIQIAALQNNNTPVIKEVGLYFEYKLYRGNRTTKINAEHFSAFRSFNYPKLVESGVYLDISWPYLFDPLENKDFKVHKAFCEDVIIETFSGIQREVLEPLFSVRKLKVLSLKHMALEIQ